MGGLIVEVGLIYIEVIGDYTVLHNCTCYIVHAIFTYWSDVLSKFAIKISCNLM